MRNPEKHDLYPMMVIFHMAKVAVRCAGCYISKCGIDDSLIEVEIFGSKTAQSVLIRSLYVRLFQGMLIISEGIETLHCIVFCKNNN